MTRTRYITPVLGCLLSLMLSSLLWAVEPPIQLELDEVNMIWDYAPHNAFTDLIRFQDQWYMSFREGTSHAVSGNGDVRVLRSSDGINWNSVALLRYRSDWDTRDAKLNILPDGRLMLNSAAAPLAATNHRQSLAWFTDNGTDWSDGPYTIGEYDYWMWGVTVHPTSGEAYGVGYGPIDDHPRTTRLYKSTDGINYSTIVPTLTSEPETGETSLLFRDDGSAVALVRDNTGVERSFVGTATGNYTNWTFQEVDKRVGGPDLIELPDGNILAASRLHDPIVRTSLSWLDPTTGQMEELLTLPSGGDTSYPGMVWHDDQLWVSYYSSHEGKASIYLAKVNVVEPEPPAPAGTMTFQEGVSPTSSYEGGAAIIRTDSTVGETEYIIVGETAGHDKTLRGVFNFDLSDLPEGAHIVSVDLTLTANRDDTAGPSVDSDFTLDLHQLTSSFVESEVTWNERTAGQSWTTPGGDFDATPLASLEANPYRLLSEGPNYTWESTADFVRAVQAALDAGVPIDMLLKTPDGEAQSDRVIFYFHSDDALDPALGPKLTIVYSTIPGDATGDGVVDENDAACLAENWGEANATWGMGDFNDDGVVDATDASIMAANWGDHNEVESNAVPEPSILILLSFGVPMLVAVRLRLK